jgi:hypothetical protein
MAFLMYRVRPTIRLRGDHQVRRLEMMSHPSGFLMEEKKAHQANVGLGHGILTERGDQ